MRYLFLKVMRRLQCTLSKEILFIHCTFIYGLYSLLC